MSYRRDVWWLLTQPAWQLWQDLFAVGTDKEPNAPIQIVYVPSHLYHILFELFKNSMRAVVEHHGSAARHYPAIQVLIIRGKEDVTIKVRLLALVSNRLNQLTQELDQNLTLDMFPNLRSLNSFPSNVLLSNYLFFGVYRYRTKAVASHAPKWASFSITCTLPHRNRRSLALKWPLWPVRRALLFRWKKNCIYSYIYIKKLQKYPSIPRNPHISLTVSWGKLANAWHRLRSLRVSESSENDMKWPLTALKPSDRMCLYKQSTEGSLRIHKNF